MEKLFFIAGIMSLLLVGILQAKEVKVCNVLRDYTFSELKLACDGDPKNATTLKEMYKKGWHFVGSSLSGSGGGVVILER